MSSTDAARSELLAAFYRAHLVPAAQALRARDHALLALSPQPSGTYYRTRDDASDYIDELQPKRTEEQLRSMWADIPELLALLEPLIALADALGQDEEAEADADVSPFVYAMF